MSNIEEVILFQIEQASKQSKKYSERELKASGVDITTEQWIILKIVDERAPISQRELADQSLRDPASITRTLDLLEKKALLRREDIPENRRQHNITLTKKGRSFVKRNLELIEQIRNQSVKGFSKKELHKLSEYLVRIKENMT